MKSAARFKTGVVLATAAALLALSACGSAGGDTPAETTPPEGSTTDMLDPSGELATAAKAEGEVVWYSGNLSGLDKVIAEFTATYGVNVIQVKLTNTELQAKFLSEAEVGAPQSDVVMTGYTGFFEDSIDAGYMLPLSDVLSNFPGDFPAEFIKDDQTPVIVISATGLVYNGDAVTDPPKDWSDLADPEYAGRIVAVDPRGSVSFQQFFDALLTEYGDDVVEGIGENVVRYYDSTSPQLQALSAGEGDIALFASRGQASVISEANPTLEFFQPDFTTGASFALGVTADSLHPNAAQLLAEWLMSDVGQQSLAENSQVSVPLSPASLPPKFVLGNDSIAQSRLDDIYAILGLD